MICQSLTPGRIRWKIPALHRQPRLAAALEHALASTPAIDSAAANPLTGSLLVRHRTSLPFEVVERHVHDALSTPALTPAEYRALQGRCRTEAESFLDEGHAHAHSGVCAHDHHAAAPTLRVLRRNVLGGGAALVAFVLIWIVAGPGRFASSLLIVAASTLATVATGQPFFRGAWHALVERRGITTDTLVTSATSPAFSWVKPSRR